MKATSKTLIVVAGMVVLCACNGNDHSEEVQEQTTEEVHDTIFEGEYRQTDVGLLLLCDDRRTYKVIGPALDELQPSYQGLVSTPGDAVKVWLEGHVGVDDANGQATDDSVFKAVALHHISAALRCPVLPNKEISGRYEVELDAIEGMGRKITLDLFADGEARMYTFFESKKVTTEERGDWGTNTDRQIKVYWPRRDQTMTYTLANNMLTTSKAYEKDVKLTLVRTGEAMQDQGATGEVKTLIAKVKTDTLWDGPPMDVPFSQWLDQDEMDHLKRLLSEEFGFDPNNHERSQLLAGDLEDLINNVRNQRKR